MDRLRNLMIEKSNNLSNTEIPHELEIEFLEEFLREYNSYNFDSYENVSNVAYLMAVLTAYDINMSFSDLIDNVRIIQDFVNEVEFDVSLYKNYLDKLLELNNLGLLDKIINNEKINKLDSQHKKIYNEYKKICKKLFVVEKDDKEQTDYQINIAFSKLFKALPQPDRFKSFLSLHVIVDELKITLKELYDEGFSDVSQGEEFDSFTRTLFKGRHFNKYIEKEKNRLINMRIKTFVEDNNMNLYEEYDIIKKHYEKIMKEAKEVVKKTNKKIKALEELEYKLQYINPSRLLKIDNINGLMLDNKIKYYYNLLVLNHNNQIYKKEEQKNIEFNNNNFNKLEILFSKYGLNFNDFNEFEKEVIINKTDPTQVENILSLIKYSELSFILDYISEFAKVIVYSKPEIIKFINNLLKNKIIDKTFLFSNIKILCDTEEFKSLYDNINYLNNIGINVVNIGKYDPEILLLDNNQIISTTKILQEYNINLDKEDIYNYEVLKEEAILDLLDNFIELNLQNIIIENPKYLTNKGFDVIKRIMICDLIGLNPINKSNKIIGSVNTGNNFYVAPEKYDNFIIDYKQDYLNPMCAQILKTNKRNVISACTKEIVLVRKLDELYKQDELTYVINGVIISRNRVLRNLEVLFQEISNNDISIHDLLYQAILYGMINNVETNILEQIYNSICLIKLENDKTYTLN